MFVKPRITIKPYGSINARWNGEANIQPVRPVLASVAVGKTQFVLHASVDYRK